MSRDASREANAVASGDDLPNARLRVRLRWQAPSLPERTVEQTVWLRGSRFRVRDEAGRPLHEILGDATAPRGLGLPARTMEEIMDRDAAARRPPAGVTEVFGDLASDQGWVYPVGRARWARPAHELVPIAMQVLARDRTANLQAHGAVTRLGRTATEYRGVVDIQEGGAVQHSAVVRVIDPPFVLLDEVRDAGNPADHYYVREVVALDVGVVGDADLSPP